MSLLLVMSFGLLFGSVRATDCPDTWVAFQGSCYQFAHNTTVFYHAVEYCHQQGGYLVHVETKLENMFIKTFLEDFDHQHAYFWIGINDETVEGMWLLQGTNDLVPFTDWLPTEPQNTHNEDCAVFTFNSGNIGWADVSCVASCRPICEIREESVTSGIIG